MIQNTKGFEEFIVNNEVSEQQEENIEKIIKAFERWYYKNIYKRKGMV